MNTKHALRSSTFSLFLLVSDILVSRFDVATTNFEANKSPTSINKFYKKYGVRIIIILIIKKRKRSSSSIYSLLNLSVGKWFTFELCHEKKDKNTVDWICLYWDNEGMLSGWSRPRKSKKTTWQSKQHSFMKFVCLLLFYLSILYVFLWHGKLTFSTVLRIVG